MPNEQVALQFDLAPLGRDCAVKVNGQIIKDLHRFEIATEWQGVTQVKIAGRLSDETEVRYDGALMSDALRHLEYFAALTHAFTRLVRLLDDRGDSHAYAAEIRAMAHAVDHLNYTVPQVAAPEQS
jgi:phosphohistidine phosphatase SixA